MLRCAAGSGRISAEWTGMAFANAKDSASLLALDTSSLSFLFKFARPRRPHRLQRTRLLRLYLFNGYFARAMDCAAAQAFSVHSHMNARLVATLCAHGHHNHLQLVEIIFSVERWAISLLACIVPMSFERQQRHTKNGIRHSCTHFAHERHAYGGWSPAGQLRVYARQRRDK